MHICTVTANAYTLDINYQTSIPVHIQYSPLKVFIDMREINMIDYGSKNLLGKWDELGCVFYFGVSEWAEHRSGRGNGWEME